MHQHVAYVTDYSVWSGEGDRSPDVVVGEGGGGEAAGTDF
jgi:hypothetical protein